MARLVAAARAEAPPRGAPRVVLRPRAVDDAGFTVAAETTPDGVRFRVRGDKPERWVRQTDFTNDEAVGYLADRLARLGVEDGAARRRRARRGRGRHRRATRPASSSTGSRRSSPGAGVSAAPRGSDLRLDDGDRPTRDERRERYEERRVARRDARDELAQERGAGLWVDPAEGMERSGDRRIRGPRGERGHRRRRSRRAVEARAEIVGAQPRSW